MAELAGGRETGVGHGAVGTGEILLMARNAGSVRDAVVIDAVAVGARPWRNRVRSGQGESGFRVVERRRLPRRSAMADLATLREAARHVIWIRRSLEVRQVASHAGRTGQVVAAKFRVVAVAALARGYGVHPRQGEAGCAVIELAIHPSRGVMTLFTGRRETGVGHGTGRTGEILLVARNAGGIRDVVVVVDVAVDAHPRRVLMHARQGKAGLRMIELAVCPLHRVMTVFATRGETLVRHRTGRVIEILLVARNTSRAGEVESVVHMAVGAHPGRVRVPPSQRESHRVVIELRIQPVVRSMTLFASCGVSERDVIRCRGFLEVRLMARIAHRGHDLKLAVGGVLVAGIAIDGRVSAGQGEAIIVLLNLLNRHAPSAYRVALLTICT